MEAGLGTLDEVLGWSFDQMAMMARKGKLRRGTPLSALASMPEFAPPEGTADVR